MQGTLKKAWGGIAKGSILTTDHRQARAEKLVWTDPLRFAQLVEDGFLVEDPPVAGAGTAPKPPQAGAQAPPAPPAPGTPPEQPPAHSAPLEPPEPPAQAAVQLGTAPPPEVKP